MDNLVKQAKQIVDKLLKLDEDNLKQAVNNSVTPWATVFRFLSHVDPTVEKLSKRDQNFVAEFVRNELSA